MLTSVPQDCCQLRSVRVGLRERKGGQEETLVVRLCVAPFHSTPAKRNSVVSFSGYRPYALQKTSTFKYFLQNYHKDIDELGVCPA